jgi:hypothetical protein
MAKETLAINRTREYKLPLKLVISRYDETGELEASGEDKARRILAACDENGRFSLEDIGNGVVEQVQFDGHAHGEKMGGDRYFNGRFCEPLTWVQYVAFGKPEGLRVREISFIAPKQ